MSERTWVDPRTVAAHVDAMLAELERRWPGAAATLRQRTVNVLASWPQVTVRSVPESAADAECAVAGAYVAGENPPVIAIAQSLSPGRQAFTALHELGHHLQRTNDDLADLLLEQPDDGHALEEAACNYFAAAIAIPGELVHRHFDESGPTAHAVVALWEDPNISASRAAVCARAAERLRSPGHVLLLDSDGQVTFGSSYGLPPVRRGSDQSRIPLVRDVLADPTHVKSGRTAIVYRDGITAAELYGQVKNMGGHIVLVAVTEHAPWNNGVFELPTRDTRPKAQWWTCSNCDLDFPAYGKRCSTCAAPKCPDCGMCDCRGVTERLCPGCFLKLPLRSFDGSSERCRDCA